MFRRESQNSEFFPGTQPHCTRPAHQREWIVTDKFAGALQGEIDRIIRVSPDRPELIGNAQNYACRVSPVSMQLGVVRQCRELCIDSLAGQRFRDNLLTTDETIGPQIPPAGANLSQIEFAQIEDEKGGT